MINIKIRQVVIREVEAPVTYPFYRLEVLNDNHCNYWKFESEKKAFLLSKQGARTTLIVYECDSKYTPLTDELLDGTENVYPIPKHQFEDLVHKHIVELLKTLDHGN